jgi:PAS domain-containing protein
MGNIPSPARADSDGPGNLTAVLDGIDSVVYVADPDSFELLFGNRAFGAAFGDDWAGRRCHEVIQQLDEPCDFCTNPYIFGEFAGRTYTWEFCNKRTGRWFLCRDRAIQWGDGRLVRLEMADDVTAERRRRVALQERVKELECLYRIARSAEAVSDADEFCRDVAEALVAAFRYPEATAVRVTLDGRSVTTDGFLDLPHCAKREIAAGARVVGRIEVVRTDEYDGEPFLAEEFSLLAAVGDIVGTALHRRELEHRFRTLIDHTSVAMIYYAPDGRVHFANKAFTETFGYTLYDAQMMD